MIMKKVDVKIRLKDFSPLSGAIINIDGEDDIDKVFSGDAEKSADEKKSAFVQSCLDNIKPSSLVINTGSANNNRSVNLYNLFNNNLYTDGYIGVLKTELETDENYNPLSEKYSDSQSKTEHTVKKLDVVIEIHSRYDNVSGKPYFLSTMLMESLGLRSDHTLVPSNDEDFFDFLLIFLFKQQLEAACAKGFYKTYVTFEENDDRPRGTIDIDRHIRLNIGQNNGKIAYSYRESTYNNPFNHLIICAYEYLRKKFPDQIESIIDDCEAYYAIRQLRTLITYSDYKNSIMIAKNLRPITHPFFLEYEALRKTCIMILRDEGVSIFSGDEEETRSILFYLPELWELYLKKHLDSAKNDYIVKSQYEFNVLSKKPINKNDIESILLPDKSEKMSFILNTRPDFVFCDKDKDERPFMILDAKFKPDKWKTENGVIVSADLDDYTKCIRDMTDLNVHATGVIYPTESEEEKASAHYISRLNPIDHFYIFPVVIPMVINNQSYPDWYNGLSDNINETARNIRINAEREKNRFGSIQKLLKQPPEF